MDRADIIWRDGSDQFSRTVRLAGARPGDALATGAAAAERVRAMIVGRFPALKGYRVELSGPGRGDVSARIALGDFEAEVRVQAGQDRALAADGQLRTCCTVILEAEARLLSLGRAERVVSHVVLVGGLAGAAGLSVLGFLLLRFLAGLWGRVVFPVALVIAVPLGGAVLGGALGAMVGGFIGRRMASRAERNATSVAATEDWNAFITEAGSYLGTITPEA